MKENKEMNEVTNETEEFLGVNREYKDSLFRMVFRKKEELLSLYNAIHDTDYQNPEDLTVNTLENAIYMSMKNDISFLIDGRMYLYEQQSTYCPNMPLRDLFYVSRLYQKEIGNKNVYSSKLLKIPTPKFVTFYIGEQDKPARKVLKLSDAFFISEADPDLELKVVMLNINSTKNQELLAKCRTLRDYVTFVEKVRTYQKLLPIKEAAEQAVQECIKDDVLAEFLKTYRAEAIAVSIFEYDFDEHMRLIAEEAREDAIEEMQQKMQQTVDEANRKAEEATQKAEEATQKAEEATQKAEEATQKVEEATQKVEEATQKAENATKEKEALQKKIKELEEKLKQATENKE